MEDDETSQNDEIEALVSIYDDALTLLPSTSGKAFEIKINEATLCLNFPPNYPSDSSVRFAFQPLPEVLIRITVANVLLNLLPCAKRPLHGPRQDPVEHHASNNFCQAPLPLTRRGATPPGPAEKKGARFF